MGKFHDLIKPAHLEFVKQQHIFFVSTAPLKPDGYISISPKGGDTFRVLSDKKVAYLDFIGSGNETSAHLLENGRITIMFCAFQGAPNILRFYGKGSIILPNTEGWESIASNFDEYPNTRQIIVVDVDLVQTSCGFGVPLFDYVDERTIMFEWADKKGEQGLKEYIKEKNLYSIDDLPTHYAVQ